MPFDPIAAIAHALATLREIRHQQYSREGICVVIDSSGIGTQRSVNLALRVAAPGDGEFKEFRIESCCLRLRVVPHLWIEQARLQHAPAAQACAHSSADQKHLDRLAATRFR
ncbi:MULTISPECIES: hypothetical protein [Xanthomonas]|uniref:Uncharacterized protein n=1 Tax=Xanthomonas dyei TaxID=743699 RepID=A0ABZ0DB79_9XANT|nr:hypothetical protein [Xanthomonas dyei]WOB27509.1 hypothetical protein NYR99_06070 [Xanthomonas dyei]WOB55131.1 hypothetical protein NYR95_06075 [Xanthomonas dyei]